MSTTVVQDTIRRSNRRLLLVCLIGILVLAGGLLLNQRYLTNLVQGPVEISKRELMAIKNAEDVARYYVTVQGDKALDTGFQQVVRRRRTGTESVSANYVALQVDRRFVLVKAPGDPSESATKFTGALLPIPSDVRTKVIADLEEAAGVNNLFLPFMLDASDFRTSGYIGLGVGAIILVLCLWGLSRAAVRSIKPVRHPIMRSFKRYGAPADIAGQINQEMSRTHQTIGQVHVLSSWLAVVTGRTMTVARLEDIVWLYLKVTQHRTNGVNTGKTYSVVIWDRHGANISTTGKEAVMSDLLSVVSQRAPWALVGYNVDVETAWKSNRGSVLSAVERRRQEFKATRSMSVSPAV
jgi:hypothetical protein